MSPRCQALDFVEPPLKWHGAGTIAAGVQVKLNSQYPSGAAATGAGAGSICTSIGARVTLVKTSFVRARHHPWKRDTLVGSNALRRQMCSANRANPVSNYTRTVTRTNPQPNLNDAVFTCVPG